MAARIYRPAKTAMSSGQANAQRWVLEFEPERPKTIEPLMGYTSSDDMRSQVRLEFDTKEEAIAYAARNGIPYQVSEPKEPACGRRSPIPTISAATERQPWTH